MPLTKCMLLEEFDILCGDVGMDNPTLFDKQALALCSAHAARDVIFEISLYDSLIPGGIIPSILKKSQSPGNLAEEVPQRLVLMSEEELKEAQQFIRMLSINPRKSYRSCSVIGLNGNVRQDLREIGRSSEVLISTPQRMIDHIRRENLLLTGVTNLTVLRTNGPESDLNSFDQDILFVHAKLPQKASMHLFTPSPQEIGELKEISRNPKIFERSEWHNSHQHLITCRVEELYPEHVLDILYSRCARKPCIVCEKEAQKQELQQSVSSAAFPFEAAVSTFSEFHPSMAEGSQVMVVYGVPTIGQKTAFRPGTDSFPDVPEIILLHQPDQEEKLQSIQESVPMKTSHQLKPSEAEVLSGKIKMLLEEVKQYKHPEELAQIKKIMRKNVPFHLRSYLFAYLLREKLEKADSPQEEEAAADSADEQEHMSTLFVSIGKNRKVFPKDLIKLFKSQLPLQDQDIGTVRVLDNYSFINVSTEYAQDAIDQMNNMKFRGRTITVNFAKKKTT